MFVMLHYRHGWCHSLLVHGHVVIYLVLAHPSFGISFIVSSLQILGYKYSQVAMFAQLQI